MSVKDHSSGGREKFLYFVDGKKYEWEASSITGADIKAGIPDFDRSFQLFVESKGNEPDRPIGDTDIVQLDRSAPHLYTAPPATFGGGGSPQ